MKDLHAKHASTMQCSGKRGLRTNGRSCSQKRMPSHAGAASYARRRGQNALLRFGAAGALSMVLLGAGVAPQILTIDLVYADDQVAASVQSDASAMSMLEGSVAKQEVVYASMAATGAVKQLFVVNTLFSEEPVMVKDFGTYSDTLNLTDETTLGTQPDSVICVIEDETFSYQGTLASSDLPWLVNISYTLDGSPISPSDLAGKSGELKMTIDTLQNNAVDASYFDNYLLQITCTLAMDKATKVATDDGSIALAGSNTSVSFSGMPGKEGSFELTAQVKDFEMEGISIAAIPFSMVLDMPDADSLVSQFDELIEGSAKLDDGALKLKDGAKALNGGAQQLSGGVDQLQSGTEELSVSVAAYVGGVVKISQGLAQLSQGSQTFADSLASLKASTEGIDQLIDGLEQQLATLKESLNGSTLSQAEKDQYAAQVAAITKQIATLKAYTANVAQLPSGYAQINGSIAEVSSQLSILSDKGEQLAGGTSELNGSVGKLADSADKFSQGASQLESGVAQLQDGTAQLHQESQGIPDKVRSEIDALLADYDKSDFEPRSFADARNSGVDLVQFVMTTEAIQVPEEKTEEPEEEKGGVLDRFFALFS